MALLRSYCSWLWTSNGLPHSVSILHIFSSSLVLLFDLALWSFHISDKREKCRRRWFGFYVRSFEWYCLVCISCVSSWIKNGLWEFPRYWMNFVWIFHLLRNICSCSEVVGLLWTSRHLQDFSFSLKGIRILWGTE